MLDFLRQSGEVIEMEDWARGDRPQTIEPRLLADRKRTFFTPHLGSAIEHVHRDIAMEAAINLVQAFEQKRPQGAIMV